MPVEPTDLSAIVDQIEDGLYLVDRDRRIVYWSPAAERISGYKARDVVGSRCSDNVLMHVDSAGKCLCQDGCPLADSIAGGKAHCAEVFMHHRDGHRVPVRVRTSPRLDASGKVIGGIETFHDLSAHDRDESYAHRLEEMAYLDDLTGIANRRYAEAMLTARLGELQRHDWSFGLLCLDIDHFKAINDGHGHDAGDAALRMVARTLAGGCRNFDLACRWGGDEFVVIVAHAGPAELTTAAERLRGLVGQSCLEYQSDRIAVTASFGAALAIRGDDSATLFNRADHQLYCAKRAGRNRVSLSIERQTTAT